MNPLLLAKAAPYAIAALLAFALAWGIQSLRLTHAEQAFTEFKQEQTRIFQEHQDAATKQREKSALDYAAAQKALADSVSAGDSYRRCVAAGRCAARVRVVTNTANCSVSPAERIDETSTDAVSPATGDAALNDCAVTTLQLNSLQADIEAQPNYTKE